MDHNDTNSPPAVLTVEKMVYGGDGLCRDQGRVTLVPLVLPGEQIHAEITSDKGQFLRAKATQILTPHAQRVQPRCPYFGTCGGCHYQHADYDLQLQVKLDILRETLARVGKFEAPADIRTVTGPAYEYRNRVQLHVDKRKIGYHKLGSNQLLEIDQCPISSPKIQETIRTLRQMARERRWPNFLKSIEIFTNETEVQVNVLESTLPVAQRFFDWCAETIPGYAPGVLHYKTAGHSFRVSHDAFFQVNRFLVDDLTNLVLEGAEGESAIDLYSGVGLFTVPLGKRFANVTAVETGSTAVRDARFNAEQAGVRVDALQMPAEAYLAGDEAKADFVVADPPRAGLGKQVVEALCKAAPQRLHIVSCDPATLARDLMRLLQDYDLESLTMVDLFPQTFHLETVAKLRHK